MCSRVPPATLPAPAATLLSTTPQRRLGIAIAAADACRLLLLRGACSPLLLVQLPNLLCMKAPAARSVPAACCMPLCLPGRLQQVPRAEASACATGEGVKPVFFVFMTSTCFEARYLALPPAERCGLRPRETAGLRRLRAAQASQPSSPLSSSSRWQAPLWLPRA